MARSGPLPLLLALALGCGAPALATAAEPVPDAAPAASIRLTDGSIIHGRLVSIENGVASVETAMGTLSVRADVIDSIDFGAETATAPAPAPAPAPPTTPPASAVASPTPLQWTPSAASPPQRPAATALLASIGWHEYSGWHWKDSGASNYSAPSFEVGARRAVTTLGPAAIDAVGAIGYFGGSHCSPDSATSCVENEFRNGYLEVAARASVDSGPALRLFVEGGPGVQLSTYSWSVPASDPNYPNQSGGSGSQSVLHPTVHVGAGASAAAGRMRVFGEVKASSADVTFPSHEGSGQFFNERVPIGMGGEFLVLGVEIGL